LAWLDEFPRTVITYDWILSERCPDDIWNATLKKLDMEEENEDQEEENEEEEKENEEAEEAFVASDLRR
jgi:hypothetical protein